MFQSLERNVFHILITLGNISCLWPFNGWGIHCLKALESLWSGSLLLTCKSPVVLGIRLIDHGRSKDRVDLAKIVSRKVEP